MWCVHKLTSSSSFCREQAVALGNELLLAEKLFHISKQMSFIDGMELYRFEVNSLDKLLKCKLTKLLTNRLRKTNLRAGMIR